MSEQTLEQLIECLAWEEDIGALVALALEQAALLRKCRGYVSFPVAKARGIRPSAKEIADPTASACGRLTPADQAGQVLPWGDPPGRGRRVGPFASPEALRLR